MASPIGADLELINQVRNATTLLLSHKGGLTMKRLSLLTLVFAFLTFVFFILLIFVRTPFPLYPLMSFQDAFDLLTPVVLIPTYWLLFKYAASKGSSLGEELVFMLFAVIWVLGQGMHLSANSVNNLAEAFVRNQEIDITGTTIYTLTYFFDEHLSHYLWHIGVIGLAGLLIYREWGKPSGSKTIWWATLLGGFLYGFTCFCIFLEGQTLFLGLPFTLIIALFGLIWGRKKLSVLPVLAFFLASCLLAFVLLAGWGLFWGGFPQFTDVGLI
jgi:hypothetical protein